MIQLFFQEIDSIPDYVDFNYSNCIDFEKVQDLLDDGFTIKEIAVFMEANENSVGHLVFDNKVKLPEGYKDKVHNVRPIVRLSIDGAVIKRYKSLAEIREDGLADGTIRRVLNGKQNLSYGSFWVYEDDYIAGNYTIPHIDHDKFSSSVAKYDLDDNLVATYKTIYDAESDSRSSRNEIYRVASGNRKSSRQEKWKFIQMIA